MSNEKELPQKLKPEWVSLAIDILVGSQIVMIAANQPGKANKLVDLLKSAINNMYEANHAAWSEDPDQFTYAVENLCTDLTHTFSVHMLSTMLKTGDFGQRIISTPNPPPYLKPM